MADARLLAVRSSRHGKRLLQAHLTMTRPMARYAGRRRQHRRSWSIWLGDCKCQPRRLRVDVMPARLATQPPDDLDTPIGQRVVCQRFRNFALGLQPPRCLEKRAQMIRRGMLLIVHRIDLPCRVGSSLRDVWRVAMGFLCRRTITMKALWLMGMAGMLGACSATVAQDRPEGVAQLALLSGTWMSEEDGP